MSAGHTTTTAHAWKRLGVIQDEEPPYAWLVHYQCSSCLALLCHSWGSGQSMGDSMKLAEISEKCPGPLFKGPDPETDPRFFVSRSPSPDPDAPTQPISYDSSDDEEDKMRD